jgi:hypothetical protein
MKYLPKILNQIQCLPKTIFRGHANSEWKLLPSIGRHFAGNWGDVLDREKQALDEFKTRSVPYLKISPKHDIEWLCLMQHYGCPTRLLDFTLNPLIAIAGYPLEASSRNGAYLCG